MREIMREWGVMLLAAFVLDSTHVCISLTAIWMGSVTELKSWDQLSCLLLNLIIWPSNKTLAGYTGTSCIRNDQTCHLCNTFELLCMGASSSRFQLPSTAINFKWLCWRNWTISTRQCLTTWWCPSVASMALHEANGRHVLLEFVNLDHRPPICSSCHCSKTCFEIDAEIAALVCF